MKEKRTNREYDIITDSSFKIKYGTLNKKILDTIYIISKIKIRPIHKNNDYSEIAIKIKKNISDYAKKIIIENNNLDNKFIYNCEMSENNLSVKKYSKFKYELYLIPKSKKQLIDYYNEIKELCEIINLFVMEQFTKNDFEVK